MKKILSLLLVITTLGLFMSSLTTLAAGETGVPLAGAGLKIVLDEDSTGLITGTVILVGPLSNIGGVMASLTYDKTKVSPQRKDNTLITASSTEAFNLVCDDVSGLTGWVFPNVNIKPTLTTPYVSLTMNTISNQIAVASGDSKSMFKFYFKKTAGQVISNTTFTVKQTSPYSSYNNGAAVNSTGAALSSFAVLVTPYVAAPTGYTVSYNTKGGVPATIDSIATQTTIPTFPADPTKDRYTFGGWYTDTDCTVAAAAAGTTLDAAVTFYAKWTAIPVTELPVVTGEVTVAPSESVTFIDKDTKQEVTQNKPVVTIPCKVPASIVVGDIGVVEFGISIGGVKFPAMTNANTFASLDGNGGKYFIKLVDPSGNLTGKTFKAFNYFGASQSAEVNVTVN